MAPTMELTGERLRAAALRGLRMLSLLSVVVCGAGCPSRQNVRFLLEPVVATAANHNAPVPVAVVAVLDRKLLDKVLDMTAAQWFAKREQLRRDFPAGDAFEEWEWEFVPGQTPPMAVIEVDRDALGAVIFANYRTPGEHRVRIGPQRKLRIDLGEDDISVNPIVTREGQK